MGRRPRPAHRAPPKSLHKDTKKPKRKSYNSKIPVIRHEPSSENEQSEDDNFFVQGSSKDSVNSVSDSEGSITPNVIDVHQDADAPRVVQWVDDDDDDQLEADALDEDSAEHVVNDLEALQDDLSSLPLGSLRKARRAVIRHNPKEEEEDEYESSEDDAPAATDSLGKGKEQEWSTRRRDDIAKRAHKHAPQEVTSKRPVTRRRQVIEVPKLQVRDPRFQPLAGSGSSSGLDARAYEKSYGFLADLRAAEHMELRENLKRARKRLASSPRDLYEERAAEVDRLEQALKRAESAVHKDRREKVDREALERAKRDEKEKRKQGKGAWHMRNSEKNELLVKARYEALAASGGRGAVRKAIEKKQRKIGQKEKRSRPYAAGPAREPEGSSQERGSKTRKRSHESDYASNGPSKRPRFS